jgi:hypothetical protein
MILITDDERKVLVPLMPELEKLSADEELFFDEFDELIMEHFTEDQQWLTPFGLKLQKMYDDIFYRNETG